MKRTLFIVICFLFLISENILGQRQRIRFDRISIEHGLTQSSVGIIEQDHKGFLWFGTYMGLIRYDGYQYRSFLNSPDDNTSIAHNALRKIFIDSDGVMWIGTEGGLSRYNQDKENFTNYYHNPKNPNSLSNDRVREVKEDKNGNLWIATEYGLNKLDRKTETFERYYHNPLLPNTISANFVRTIFEDSQGRFWVGTDNGLDLFDRETGIITHYKYDPKNPYSISDNKITVIKEDLDGRLWIGTRDNGLNRLDPGVNKFIRYINNPYNPLSISHNYVRDILVDRDGELWIGTYGGGLNKYDNDRDAFINYKNNPDDRFSLSGNSIYSLFQDRSGLIWIGTDFGGISILDKRKNQFLYYGNIPNNPNSLNNNNVYTFYEDPIDKGKTMWIGTLGGGLTLFDRVNDKFTFYTNIPNNSNSISNNLVRAVIKDKFGYLWIATDNGLNRFDLSEKKIKRYLPDPSNKNSINHYMLKTIYEDKSGVIWIGANGGGLIKYDRTNDHFTSYLPNERDTNSISDNIVWCILEDSNNNFWIGTNSGGLNLFDRKEEKFKAFKKNKNDPNSISNNKILTMIEDKNGIIWIGTAGGGLNRFDKQTGIFEKIDLTNGLISNTVHGLIEDDDGFLWISTTDGISKYDPVNKNFSNFNVQDGLQSNEFHVNSVYKSLTGELFFGGISGFNIFNPRNIKGYNYIPQVVLTDFQIFNQSVPISDNAKNKTVLTKSITVTDKIILSYKDEVFSFEFAALDYSAPNKNKYAYIMEGFEKEWNYVGNRRFATYTKLPAGKYTFKVKGTNHNGIWSDETASVEIIIIPPFWGTWLFRSFLIILLFVLIFLLYKVRTARIRAYSKKLERQVQERTAQLENANKELEAFSYSVSHDLRAPLRAIDGYSKIFIEDYGSRIDYEGKRLLEVISQSSQKMGNLINDLLSFSKVGRVELKLQEIDMKGLVDSVLNEILENTLRDRYLIKINIEGSIIGDEALLRQVWTNLISNAIKFSAYSKYPQIQIGMSVNESEIVYFVADNGAGFDKQYTHKLFKVFQRLHKEDEFEGTGVGLAIVYRIIDRHGGKVWAEGELGKGARFYFSLPRKEI